MGSGQTGLPAFFASILGELSLLGRFTAFFGTVLTLWGIAVPGPVKLFAGIALLLFTFSDGFWQRRYRAMVRSPRKSYRWYQRWAWSRVFFALAFFIAFLLVGRAG